MVKMLVNIAAAEPQKRNAGLECSLIFALISSDLIRSRMELAPVAFHENDRSFHPRLIDEHGDAVADCDPAGGYHLAVGIVLDDPERLQ
jgi:hypothetical protein